MKKLLAFFFFIGTYAVAQDIHFSQYPYSPLTISPSSTGVFDGDIRVNAIYRRQWNAVTIPYKTIGLAYDQAMGIPSATGSRNGAGIVLSSDRAGDGNFGTLQILLSYARLQSLNADSIHFISVGAQAGLVYRSVDYNKLTFDNQFTGDVFNPLSASKENFDRTSYIYPDINVGAGYTGIFASHTTAAFFTIQHLIEPDQTFLDESNGLPPRYIFHAGSWLKRDDKFSYYPSLLWMRQAEFKELTAGIELKFRLQEGTIRNRAVSIGGHYRVQDAIIPSFALYYDQWRFGVSYDINTSALKKASAGRGGPEVNVIYILKKIRYSPVKNNCPVY